MICHEAGDLLPAYLDHELTGPTLHLLEEHLAGCAACRTEIARQSALDARVAILRSSVPSAGIIAGVMRRVAGEPVARRSFGSLMQRLSYLAALAVILIVAVASAFALLPGRRAGSPPAASNPARLYLLRHEPVGSLLVLDAATLSPVSIIPLGANPTGLSVAPDGQRIYVSGGLGDVTVTEQSGLAMAGVWVLDGRAMTVTDSIPVGYAVWDVARGASAVQLLLTLQPTGRYLRTEGAGPDLQLPGRPAGQLLSLDTASRKTAVLADLGALPRALVTTPDGKLAFAISHDAVAYEDTTLTIVDIPARRTLATIAVPNSEALAVAPNGQRVFVAPVSEPYIHVIERSNLMETVSYRLAGLPGGAEVRQIAVSADGLLLALALAGNNGADGGLVILDTRRFDTLLALPVPGGYGAVAFAPDRKTVYAATPGGRLDVIESPGGRLVKSVEGVSNVWRIVVK